MKLIDTHAHLYSSKFDRDKEAVYARAKEALDAVVLPNIDLGSIEPMHQLADSDPDFFFPAMGLHPTSVDADAPEEQLQKIKDQLDQSGYVYYAIGETGLDLYWDKDKLDVQRQSLDVHIRWAKGYELPIILHAREAIDEVSDMIEKHLDTDLKGVMHCFDGNLDQARRIMEWGSFKLGIGGNSTYRKDIQQMLKQVPLDAIILETDSPYLPPEPFRKAKPRRNESSYTRYVADNLAQLHGISLEEVIKVTSTNAIKLFALPI